MRFVIRAGDDILWLMTKRGGGWRHISLQHLGNIMLEFWLKGMLGMISFDC